GTVISSTKISDAVNFPGFPLDDGDWFGSSVAFLGDLDGAGPSVAAIAVGAPGDLDGAGPSTRAIAVGAFGDDAGGTDQGAVYILFLNSSGTVLSTQKVSDVANLPGSPLDIGDNFGGSVASLGDLDGAGPSVLALAVGAQLDDDGGIDRGAVYILFLNAGGT